MSKFEAIKKVLEKKAKGKVITEDTAFKDLGLDSLDLVELVLEVEKELNFRFKDEDLINFKTVRDVLNKLGE